MSGADFELVANVSLLFAELPLPQRFAAAAAAGFQSVELWWPFDGPVPPAAEVDEFIATIRSSGLPLSGLNLWAGDMPAGDRGVVSLPAARPLFEANLDVVVEIARRTGCRVFNALYGQRQPAVAPEAQDAVAIENLAMAARKLGSVGGTVLLEPLSRGLNGAYPVETLADALPIIRRVREVSGLPNIALLFDTFHLTNNGEELIAAVHTASADIGHVQLADAPGRGEPGTGTVDFVAVMDALAAIGYSGAVACEFVPTVPTADALGWIDETPHLRLRQL